MDGYPRERWLPNLTPFQKETNEAIENLLKGRKKAIPIESSLSPDGLLLAIDSPCLHGVGFTRFFR
jgi:hypothetical protein